MAKITAIAKAMKAAGWAGGLDLLRAVVMLHLLLGTLPHIPPPEGGPPDQPPPADDPPPSPPARGEPPEPPPPRDEDAPPDDGLDAAGGEDPDHSWDHDVEDDGDQAGTGPVPPWPDLGVLPRAPTRSATKPDAMPFGLLDVTLPWETWAGLPGGGAGALGRIGPITPAQARELARAAERDPAARWRITITNSAGQAIAVTRLRRRIRAGPDRAGPARAGPARAGPARAGPDRGGPDRGGPDRGGPDRGGPDRGGPDRGGHSPPPAPAGSGLFGRVTLTISQDLITQLSRPLPPMAAAALDAATKALDHALVQATADAAAQGCAHTAESGAYRPPPRLREFVIARDVTCRFPTCRQPAWRADLDHTIPYDRGGRSCACNLGGRCRRHHILKQHRRWKLEQNERGEFTWSTPAGRRYVTRPDAYPL
jgi:hypothetical protein